MLYIIIVHNVQRQQFWLIIARAVPAIHNQVCYSKGLMRTTAMDTGNTHPTQVIRLNAHDHLSAWTFTMSSGAVAACNMVCTAYSGGRKTFGNKKSTMGMPSGRNTLGQPLCSHLRASSVCSNPG